MDSVACNLCGSTAFAWSAEYSDNAARESHYHLVRCAACGLVYVNPRPPLSELVTRYPWYLDIQRDMLAKLSQGAVGRLGIRILRKARVPRGVAAQRRILDIGCADGDYLTFLRGLGWQTTGIELDAAAAAHARDVHALKILTASAEDGLSQLADQSFDVVTLWHVLEHVDDARRVLTEVHRVLRPGGSVIVEVPNFRSVWASLLGGAWFPLEYPYHRYHFTPRTLTAMLQRTGFTVQSMEGQPTPAQTIWSLQMVWERLRAKPWDGHLIWSPLGVMLLYPLEILLARLGRSNHMKVVAVALAGAGASAPY